MDDRAWELFQELVQHYENVAMGLSDFRDRFVEDYARKPRITFISALGELGKANYHLDRIEYELNNFFSAHGWSASSSPFMDQEKQLQELHLSLLAALKVSQGQNIAKNENLRGQDQAPNSAENAKLLEQTLVRISAENEKLRGQNQTLYSEYRRIKEQDTLKGQKIEDLQQKNDRLNRIARYLKDQASQANNWQAGYQTGLSKAHAAHDSEREGLRNHIYQLNAQIRTLQAERQDASLKAQAELDDARKELARKDKELASLMEALRKLQAEQNRGSVESPGAKEEKGRNEDLPPREAPEKQQETRPDEPIGSPEPQAAPKMAGGLLAKFALTRVPAPLTGSKAEILKKIEEASHVEAIMDFLAAQQETSSYRIQLAKCAPKFRKLLEKAAAREEDEDFVEDIALEYFKIIRDVVLSNMMSGIQRNYAKDPQLYGQFLDLMNKWLTSCGIYTRMVLPGARPEDEDYEDMTFLTKTVDDPARHGIMERVERLPYYMDYQEADGEIGKYHYDGQAISLRFVDKQEQA